MADAIAEALTNLKAARQEQAMRVAEESQKLANFDDMIAKLESSVVVVDPALIPRRKDYEGLGIIEATKRLLSELGRELTTPEIAQELLARGLKSKSTRLVPTVYATLHGSKKFVRKGDGRAAKWALKKARV
jgi:hypothetical protein